MSTETREEAAATTDLVEETAGVCVCVCVCMCVCMSDMSVCLLFRVVSVMWRTGSECYKYAHWYYHKKKNSKVGSSSHQYVARVAS